MYFDTYIIYKMQFHKVLFNSYIKVVIFIYLESKTIIYNT